MKNEFLCARAIGLRQGGIRAIFDKAAAYENVINLGIGEPDAPTPAPIIDKAYEALKSGRTHYTANAGAIEARKAVSGYLQRFNIYANPASEIIITSGGMAAVSMALFLSIEPGCEVLIQDPQWMNYCSQVQFMGGRIVRVPVFPENEFVMKTEDIEKAVTKRTKILILNSPNNPTGAVMSRKDQEAVAKLAIERDLLVISDEVYCELTYDGIDHESIASLPNMKERTIVVNSLSKTFAMTGWRVGFAAGPEYYIRKMIYLQENLVACASTAGQYAAVYALETLCGVKDMKETYAHRRDIVTEGLNDIRGIRCNIPKGAFYAFPDIRGTGLSCKQVSDMLLEKAGIVTIPGSAFGTCGEGYLRISYAASEASIVEAMQRMKALFN